MPSVTHPRLLLSGIDSLYVSYYVDTAASLIDWEQLEWDKTQLASDRNSDLKEYVIGGERFALLPSGRFPYRYVLKNRDFEIRLSEALSPGCHVQFFSEGLWLQSTDRLIDRVEAWFEALKIRQTRENAVSRIDWAYDCDLPFVDFEPDHILTRAAKEAFWRQHKTYQTLQVGSGDVVIRMYDKIAEITEASDKVFFFDLWGQKENVWRIEAQVRSGRLKKAGIKSTADIAHLSGDLLHDLYHRHTTLRVPTEDTNQSRWPLHPLWQSLQRDIAALPRNGLIEAYSPVNGIEYRLHCIGKSLAGYAKRKAMLEYIQNDGTHIPDPDWAIESLANLIKQHVRPETWDSDVEKLLARERYGL